jgi:superfamily II DNA or RNA helicase
LAEGDSAPDSTPSVQLDLPPAYPDRAAWGTATSLRAWQTAALKAYQEASPRDFLAVATPGAGKTTFALTVAADLLARRVVDRITVVAPTEHLKTQWAEAAAKVGIPLDPAYSGRTGRSSSDFVGIALTYAGVAANPLAHRIRTERFNTMVILDEVHHAGDALSWGEAVREAFEPARRRLALTGTPFRSDINPIPFVTYAPDADGVPRSVSDYTYGYAHALADHVVRPVLFMAYSGSMQWRTRAGDEVAARLGEPLTKDLTAQALRTALDPGGAWIPSVLAAADRRLSEVRRHVPDAGGLVIASDQALRREGRLEEDRSLRRGRFPLDGGGADGLRRCRRASSGRRCLRHQDLDPALLRPGGGPVRPGPQARGDRLDLPALGAAAPGARLRDGGRA